MIDTWNILNIILEHFTKIFFNSCSVCNAQIYGFKLTIMFAFRCKNDFLRKPINFCASKNIDRCFEMNFKLNLDIFLQNLVLNGSLVQLKGKKDLSKTARDFNHICLFELSILHAFEIRSQKNTLTLALILPFRGSLILSH